MGLTWAVLHDIFANILTQRFIVQLSRVEPGKKHQSLEGQWNMIDWMLVTTWVLLSHLLMPSTELIDRHPEIWLSGVEYKELVWEPSWHMYRNVESALCSFSGRGGVQLHIGITHDTVKGIVIPFCHSFQKNDPKQSALWYPPSDVQLVWRGWDFQWRGCVQII